MFKLVNPHILDNNFSSNNESPEDAASEIWSKFSKKYIKKATNEFYYSIGGNDKLYHFKVQEKIKGNKVNFNITQLESDHKNDEKILNVINEMSGGKYYDSSSSSSSSTSSSSSDDNYYHLKRRSYYDNPITYNPITYYPTVYRYYRINGIDIPHIFSYKTPYTMRLQFPNFDVNIE